MRMRVQNVTGKAVLEVIGFADLKRLLSDPEAA